MELVIHLYFYLLLFIIWHFSFPCGFLKKVLLNASEVHLILITKSRRLRWAGHVARMEEGRSAFRILTGKPTGKRPLGRPRCRWEDNIRMDLEQIGISAGNRFVSG